MTTKRSDGYEPGRGYTRQDWDDVSDNPEWSHDDVRKAKPFSEMFPELVNGLSEENHASGAKSADIIVLDHDIAERLQRDGGDWRERANAILRKAVGL